MTTETSAPITSIANIGTHVGRTVTVRGWLYNLRASGKLLFPIFRDGTGTIQGIVPKAAVPPEVFETLKDLQLESSLTVTGKVRADSRAPSGFELDVEDVTVQQAVRADQPFPITLKEHGPDFLMEHRHLWMRTPRQSAILRVRATIMRAAAEFFDTQDFTRTDPPVLTPAACEGTSELFEMKYFDEGNAYLTQSGQLYIEATALALGKVYSFGPTFRAEKSKTRRHLTEFWMIEPEVAFADLKADADLAEDFLKYIFRAVLNERPDDMKFFAERIDKECISRLEKFVDASFERMTYTDAIGALERAKKSFEFPVKWGVDLQSEHERFLTEELIGRPVVVMNYPKQIKAFYMRLNEDEKTVAAMDVLAPGIGEIIGGSQREERLDVLDRRLDESRLDKAAYWWYRDLRRYGTVPHAGFGLGFERTIMYATGMANVRDVIPFPRTPKNAEF
jgi:asparaginyl-tRNA synthetase